VRARHIVCGARDSFRVGLGSLSLPAHAAGHHSAQHQVHSQIRRLVFANVTNLVENSKSPRAARRWNCGEGGVIKMAGESSR
jgi:hypothetical protein